MARFLKTSALLALVVGLVWLAVIVWWQETRTLPTELDVVLYLVALPLGLLLLGWLGIKAVRAARAPKAEPVAQTDTTSGNPPEAPTHAHIYALGAAAQSGAGTTPAAIRQAAAQPAGAALDPILVSHQGFPIMTVRAAHIDTAALREAAAARSTPAAAMGDDVLRATALLQAVMQSLAQQAREAIFAAVGPKQERDWPSLRIDLLLPARWPDEAMAQASDACRAAVAWRDDGVSVVAHRADTGATGTDATQDWLRALGSAPACTLDIDLRVIAACESSIDPKVVDDWESNGRLLGSTQPAGHLPGEAAAGLLLDLGRNAASHASATLMTFSPVIERSTAADARGATTDPAVTALAGSLMAQESINPDQVGSLISDADHRGSRAMETLSLAASTFTHLDPNQDCLSLGNACGTTGVAASLLTLAVAADACATSGAPALVVMTQDATARAFTLVALPPIAAA